MAEDNNGTYIALGLVGAVLGGVALYLGLKGTQTCPPNSVPVPGYPGQCCPNNAVYDPPSGRCVSNGTGGPGSGPSCGGLGGCSCQRDTDCTSGFTCYNATCQCQNGQIVGKACVTSTGPCANCSPPNFCIGDQCYQPQNADCMPGGCNPPYFCNNRQCIRAVDVCGGCTAPEICESSTRTCYMPCPTCTPPQYCDTSLCFELGFVDFCGHCTGPTPPWTATGVQINFAENVTALAPGDPVDANITFTYVGPGGYAVVGFRAVSGGVTLGICSATFTNQALWWLDTALTPTQVTIPTLGLVWIDNTTCPLCDLVAIPFDVTPFVLTPDGQPWTGTTNPGAMSC
jgi:hypothetical protein